MKKESQNIEYKQSWRDEYLKWICGFANAEGGRIYIGIDDKGKVIGIDNARKLLEDLPNKIKDILGIISDVKLKTEKSKEYIEIITEAYPYPVNYYGQYHYRTGSTKQELKGQALDRFLLQKQGKRWDGVPVPDVKLVDLKSETFELFKIKAAESKRVSPDILKDGNNLLLEDLNLKDGKHFKRAAILLFHPKPEKFITGAYIKIGYFETDDELKFQDEVHGNIFEQIEKATDLLFSKYIKADISYKGVNRIETYEYPKDAIREALLNSVAHKDYSGKNPIQISVYSDKIVFWNEGNLPENWTLDYLKSKHPSKPFNPDIANALSRSGYIEAWGRGTIKMIQECRKSKLPDPAFYFHASGFVVEFRKDIYVKEILEAKGIESHLIDILLYTKKNGSVSNSQIQDLLQVSKRTSTRYLKELEDKGHIIKYGETGKGTSYTLKGPQRGQNDPKGAKKGTVKSDSKTGQIEDVAIDTAKAARKAPKTPKKNVRKTSETSDSKQRGQNGVKGVKKGPKKPETIWDRITNSPEKVLEPKTSLAQQLAQLKKDLAKSKSNKEIKKHFSKVTFLELYDKWLSKTLFKLIKVGQQFNEFYTSPAHFISTQNNSGVSFNNQKPEKILADFRKDCENSNNFFNETILYLGFRYTTFKRTDKQLKSFGCNYSFEIEFSFTEYKVFLDTFTENDIRTRELKYKKLLHEPLTTKEINQLTKDLGNTLIKHIQFKSHEMGLI